MLRLLHPFMPFISEEIWQVIRPYLMTRISSEHLAVAKFPDAREHSVALGEEDRDGHCIAATEAVNSLRSLLGWHPGQRVQP